MKGITRTSGAPNAGNQKRTGSYSVKNKKSLFPTPQFKRVFDTDRSKKAIVFFEYWSKLPPDKIELCRVKIFRTWPQIDVRLVDPDKKDISVDAFDGAIPFEYSDYVHFFLERYSSGSWNCQLYDISTEGGPEKVIECFFDAQDLYSKKENGEDKYPVRVDLRTVQWGKTHNRNFEEYLRARNIPIPGQEGAEYQEAQEMNAGITATTELAKSAMERSDRLAEEKAELVQQVVESKIEAINAKIDKKTEEPTGTPAMKMIQEAASASIEIVKQQGLGAAKLYDPVAMLTQGIDLAKANAGGNNMDMIKMVIDLSRDQHTQTMSYLRERDEKAAQAAALAAQNAPQPQKGGIDLLIEEAPKLEALKNLFGWGGRRHDEAPPPAPEPKSQWLEKLVEKPENLQMVMGIFALASNMVATLFGRGKPPEEVIQQTLSNPAGTAGTSVTPTAPGAPQPAPAPVDKKPSQAELNQMFLEFIEPMFLEHFFDGHELGLNGASFAKSLCSIVQTPEGTQWANGAETPVGRQQFELIRAGGQRAFDNLLRSYSPIWSQVAAFAVQPKDSKEPPKYFQFLNEFFSYDLRTAQRA
jgi:hypothetical protein